MDSKVSWLVWVAGACHCAAVTLSSVGGMWLQVSGSAGLHPFSSFGGALAWGQIFTGSLCLSSVGGLREHFTCGTSH